MRTFNNADPKIKSQLDILWMTKGYTPHAFAVKKTMPEDARRRLVAALTSLELSEEGIRLLEAVNFKGIMAASNEDWQDVKALELETLVGK